MPKLLPRRRFLQMLASGAVAATLPGCSSEPEAGRYDADDVASLAAQREREQAASGTGRLGVHRYQGYRGLAELPWFELDANGDLIVVADDFPTAVDVHIHFGISVFLAPELDLFAETARVEHLLDCDGSDPACPLDLDVYVNGNFREEDLERLQWNTIAQGFWGSSAARTQTIPNLLREMDATRVGHAVILPIAVGVPWGDDLTERWAAAIQASESRSRMIQGASVHPRDDERIAKLEAYAADGARIVKLHPTVQRFYPDDPAMMEVYEACERLGLAVFFHCGRAGIEPESSHRYAMPRHYEAAVASFPKLPFVLGHAGARDADGALDLSVRYENAWLGIHGQPLRQLDEMIRRTGGERMLFGSDWPFYHIAASLAKVLLVTDGDDALRARILRSNAEQLLGPLA